MIKCTDGSRFNGVLKEGQVWVKGKTVRVIVRFDENVMVYKSKTDFKNNTVTTVRRSVFRRWLHSGEKAMLYIFPKVNCSNCDNKVELRSHINRCECGAVMKVLE
ncbi:hypothetical protein [Bacillus cereus group sp. Bce029]|uniref:hypothetical protein n=1 Tax=Bacillus cereus group sp. Bce029 TaxID=3445239 RepID=UPI0040412C0B